jgi:DNA-binding transcriptional LysR family regulator
MPDTRSPTGALRYLASCVWDPGSVRPAFTVPVVCEFLERHLQVEIELKVSDRKVDLLEQGLDLATRIREMTDPDLKARRIGELRTVVVGAAGYFASHGRPRHPDELAKHPSQYRARTLINGGSVSKGEPRACACAGGFEPIARLRPTLL